MKNAVKRMMAMITAIALVVMMSGAVTAADIIAQYDKEIDNGNATLTGVKTTGRSQTILVLSDDSNSASLDSIVWLDQKDDGTAIDRFRIPNGVYANLDEGESATYYVRIGGSNGTIQTAVLTVEKEVTATPNPESTEKPTEDPVPQETEPPSSEAASVISKLNEWLSDVGDYKLAIVDWTDMGSMIYVSPEPTVAPTPEPTATPTSVPTVMPTPEPTPKPTATPTPEPTVTPTTKPTEQPIITPSIFDDWLKKVKDACIADLDWNALRIINNSTPEPTATPTPEPTAKPTPEPTATPTPEPTAKPTSEPTATPTAPPAAEPTATPAASPTTEPTATPTTEPDVKCKFTVDEDVAEVSAVITNTYEEDKKVVVAVAQYDEKGILVNIKLNEITVPAKTSEQYTVKADSISENKSRINGFIWDGISSMKPIAKLIE